MREMRGRRREDGSLSKRRLLGLLCGGIRKGISKRFEDSEVQVMKFRKIFAGYYHYGHWEIIKLHGAWSVKKVYSNANQQHFTWCSTIKEAKQYIARIEQEAK